MTGNRIAFRLFVVVMMLLIACGLSQATESQAKITNSNIKVMQNATEFELFFDGDFVWTEQSLPEDLRLIYDFHGARLEMGKGRTREYSPDSPVFSSIRIAQFKRDPDVVRVVITLKEPVLVDARKVSGERFHLQANHSDVIGSLEKIEPGLAMQVPAMQIGNLSLTPPGAGAEALPIAEDGSFGLDLGEFQFDGSNTGDSTSIRFSLPESKLFEFQELEDPHVVMLDLYLKRGSLEGALLYDLSSDFVGQLAVTQPSQDPVVLRVSMLLEPDVIFERQVTTGDVVFTFSLPAPEPVVEPEIDVEEIIETPVIDIPEPEMAPLVEETVEPEPVIEEEPVVIIEPEAKPEPVEVVRPLPEKPFVKQETGAVYGPSAPQKSGRSYGPSAPAAKTVPTPLPAANKALNSDNFQLAQLSDGLTLTVTGIDASRCMLRKVNFPSKLVLTIPGRTIDPGVLPAPGQNAFIKRIDTHNFADKAMCSFFLEEGTLFSDARNGDRLSVTFSRLLTGDEPGRLLAMNEPEPEPVKVVETRPAPEPVVTTPPAVVVEEPVVEVVEIAEVIDEPVVVEEVAPAELPEPTPAPVIDIQLPEPEPTPYAAEPEEDEPVAEIEQAPAAEIDDDMWNNTPMMTPVEQPEATAEIVQTRSAPSPVLNLFNESPEESLLPIRLSRGENLILGVKNLVRAAVADPEVADVIPITDKELMLIGKKQGRTTLIIWEGLSADDSANTRRYVRWIEVTLDMGHIAKQIEDLINYPNVRVTAIPDNESGADDPKIGAIILEGTVQNEYQKIRASLIAQSYFGDIDELTDEQSGGAGGGGGQGGGGESGTESGQTLNKDSLAINTSKIYSTSPNVVNLIEIEHPRQVLVQVRLLELDKTRLDNIAKSVSFTGQSEAGDYGFTVNTAVPSTGGLLGLQIDPSINEGQSGRFLGSPIDLQLNMIETEGWGKVLARTNLVVLSGHPARFRVGGEVPYQTSSINGTSIEFKPFGILVNAIPTISASGRIHVQVLGEVRTIDDSIAAGESVGFKLRDINTTVNIDDGEAIIIGGLYQEEITKQIDKVPGLAEIPILGKLFRSKKFRRGETELIFILTPVIVEDPEEIEEQMDLNYQLFE